MDAHAEHPAELSHAPEPSRAPEPSCLWVAANRADGPPHVTPVWFVGYDDALWFTTSSAAHKAGLILADGQVSLVYDGSADGGGAVAEGRATVLDIDARPDVIAAFAEKYHGWDAADRGNGVSASWSGSTWTVGCSAPDRRARFSRPKGSVNAGSQRRRFFS